MSFFIRVFVYSLQMITNIFRKGRKQSVRSIHILLASYLFLLFSCTSHPENVSRVDALPEICPDYTDVTIPVELAPLNFGMADED